MHHGCRTKRQTRYKLKTEKQKKNYRKWSKKEWERELSYFFLFQANASLHFVFSEIKISTYILKTLFKQLSCLKNKPEFFFYSLRKLRKVL